MVKKGQQSAKQQKLSKKEAMYVDHVKGLDDGTVKVMFIPSLENRADIFTKNTNITIFQSNLDYIKV